MALGSPTHLVIATLAPVSIQGKEALYHRHNRPHLLQHQSATFRRAGGESVVKLDFNALLGQLCFSFGSSRASDVWLRDAVGVEAQHFVLFLDPDNKRLCIKDTSNSGTTVTYAPDQVRTAAKATLPNGNVPSPAPSAATTTILFRGQMLPVSASMVVSCGEGGNVRFQLCLADDALRQTKPFTRCLSLYAKSVAQWRPEPAGKRLRSEPDRYDAEPPSQRRKCAQA